MQYFYRATAAAATTSFISRLVLWLKLFLCIFFNQCFIVCINFLLFFCSLHWTSRAKKVDSKAINCVCWKVLLLSKKLLPPLLLLLLLSSTPSVFSQLLSFLLSISSLLRWYIKNRLPWHDVCVYMCRSWLVKMDICSLHDLFTFYFSTSISLKLFSSPLVLSQKTLSLILEHVIFNIYNVNES